MTTYRYVSLAVPLLLLPLAALAQPAPPAAPADAATPGPSATLTLSPFEVRTEKDQGYAASNTLSGTRLNSSLANIPASIQVLTKELILDLNVTDYEGYLNFATNSGRDFSDVTGLASVQQGNNQIRIRGFTGAAQTRDYFQSITRSDRFSIDRFEVSRGPNSILFGIGGPGGVVNAGSKFALLGSKARDEVRATVGSWDNRRVEADFNRELVRGKFAVRLNGLFEDKEGWRDFEFEKRKGIAVATAWQPGRTTRLRTNYEYVDTRQNQAMPFPVSDFSDAWVRAGKPLATGPIFELGTPAPAGTQATFANQLRFAPQVSPNAYRYGDNAVVDANPALAGAQRVRFFDTLNGPNATSGGTVTSTLFDQVPESANLGGPGSTSNNRYGLFTALLEQRVGPINIELGYNRQEDLWRSNFVIPWNLIGLRGDANRELPGTYLPTGTLGATPPGQPIANAFAPNPFAGKFYVEGNAGYRLQRRVADNYRATLSYELDLRRRSQWLGQHQVAALAQRADDEYYNVAYNEYNTAGRDNTLPVTNAANVIIRRTYVDFTTPGGARGAHDPWLTPISSPGVRPEFLSSGGAQRTFNRTDTVMAVMQSNFLEERLVVTLGARRDQQETNRAIGSVLLPNADPFGGTRTENTVYSPAGLTSFSGNTRTFGAVFRPVRWAALVYNSSDSVRPVTSRDLLGNALAPQKGVGKDYGARFFLLDNRVVLGVTRYDTDNVNGLYDPISTRTTAIPAIAGIYQAFTDAGIAAKYQFASLFAESRDNGNSDGGGWEVELTANPTSRWRVSLNYGRADLQLSDVGQRMAAFLSAETPFWQRNAAVPYLTRNNNLETFIRTRDGTPQRDFATNPARVSDAGQYALDIITTNNQQEGQSPLQHQRESLNFFNSFSFPKLPLLGERCGAGFGASYRSAPVIGYNGKTPLYGQSFVIWNGMLKKRFELAQKRALELQLNVNNLFGEEDILPFAATAAGVNRWTYQRQRQSWALQAAFTF